MFNTHFDNEGKQARENSAKLILKKTDKFSAKNTPVFITGDFNSNPAIIFVDNKTTVLKYGILQIQEINVFLQTIFRLYAG